MIEDEAQQQQDCQETQRNQDNQGHQEGYKDNQSALHAAATWSQVSKQQTGAKKHLLWLGGAVLTMVLVMFASEHHAKSNSQNTVSQRNLNHYHTELAANLPYLKAMAAKQAAATPRLCEIEGCGRRYLSKGLCGMHYQRSRK